MDQIRAMLNRLSELTDNELSELEESIISEFKTVVKQEPTQASVDAMTELADAVDAVRGESTRRVETATQVAQAHEELSNRINGSDDSGETSTEVEEVAAVEDVPVEDDEDTEPVPDEEDDEDEVVVTAAVEDEAVVEAAAETEVEAAVEEEAAADAAVEEPAELAVSEEPAAEEPAELSAEAEVEAEAATVAAAEVENDDNPDTTTSTSEEPVTASAEGSELEVRDDIQPPADRRPRITTAPVSITAGADIPGVSAGAPLEDMGAIAEAMISRMHTMRRVQGGDGEQHTVASLVASFPEDRVLRTSDSESNARKIDAVLSPQAVIASGGWCAPLEVRYDVFDSGGSTDRPVRDALSPFSADRGGIRYMTAPTLAGFPTAAAIWTAANDADPTPTPATKTCVAVACGTPVDVSLDAITLCLTFGNMASRAYPELVSRQNEIGLIQHARFAENNLLTKMATGSTAVTAAKVLSAARDFLVQVDKAAAAYRYRHRVDPDFPLRVVAPEWMRNLVRADLTMQMPGDGQDTTFALADAAIDNFLRVRHINATWHKDGTGFAAQGAGALLDFPSTVPWFLFAEGTWLFLDGGTLDLGLVRDSTLNGTNDYQMFLETFEAVAKVGDESLIITSTLDDCGSAAALVETCAVGP